MTARDRKPDCVLFNVLAVGLILLFGGLLHAEDWKTTDGKVYQEVKVVRVEPDSVTILDRDGGARIPLATLPAGLQQRFHYDPTAATAATAARVKEAAANAKALQEEMDRASAMHQAGPEPEVAATPATDSSAKKETVSVASASSNPNHHSLAELDSSTHTLQLNSPDANHHSINDMTLSSTSMRRDLTDPNYHTMAHLEFTVRTDGLGPDTSDTTRHPVNEVGDTGIQSVPAP